MCRDKVGQDIIDMIETFRKWQDSEAVRIKEKWIDSGKIFTDWNGKPINFGTVTSWLHKFIQNNKLPQISIHALRHTNASIMISSGVPTPPKKLRHSTSATTNRYMLMQ